MQLHIGDRVAFELQDNGRPRWSGSIDYGGNGRWVSGLVIEVTATHALIRYAEGTWRVPLSGDSDYVYNQWQRPGFLQRSG